MFSSLITRQCSLVIYDEQEPTNYVASCQIFIYGDRGFMYTINGKDFYKYLATDRNMEKLFKDLNINTLEGYVVKSHARLMRMALRDVVHVHIGKSGKIGGIDAVWVEVSLLNGE